VVYSRAVATRSAIVTGGGTGIGAAIADRLSADGYAVTVMGRRAEPLDEVVEQLGEGLAVTGDVRRPEDCERVVAATVETFGGVDALVNNAGIGNAATGLEETPEQWDLVLRTNLSGAFYLFPGRAPAPVRAPGVDRQHLVDERLPRRARLDVLLRVEGGSDQLTRCLANEYGPAGVRANCVCPGWVRTPMGAEDMDALGRARGLDREGAYDLLHEDVPARRPADAEEIASVVSFLVGPDANYVNGVTLPADAGASIYDPTSAAFADPA
jgi:meso-butanediol dehydrogenase / (S,S)-butanediol dehydrogenase / diacetyl reductase